MKYATAELPSLAGGRQTNLVSQKPWLRHPVCAYLGLRPSLAQHTSVEHEALRKWAQGARCVVEIGVAEGVSALALREAMADDGTLYLIDPFHLSRIPALNFIKRVARRTVDTCSTGRTVWIEKFSQDAVMEWTEAIDVILIDGDHSEGSVERDWMDWNKSVKPGGVVMFHDARLFDRGWTTADYGPVKFVDRVLRRGLEPDWTIAEEIHSLFIVQRNT